MIVETFTTPNKKTKTGLPERWRWKIIDERVATVAKSRHSYRTEAKALVDVSLTARGLTKAVLRRPGHDDAPWVPHL